MQTLVSRFTGWLLLAAAAFAYAQFAEHRMLEASPLASKTCLTGSDFVGALADAAVHIAIIANDISISSEEWAAYDAPVILSRNVTICGIHDAPERWPLLDLGNSKSMIRLGQGVAFNITRLVLMNWRNTPHFQAPGLDAVAISNVSINSSGSSRNYSSYHNSTSGVYATSPPSRLAIGWNMILIHRSCLPLGIYLASVVSLERPPNLPPGAQNATQLRVDSATCENRSSAPAARRCWPGMGVFIDVGFNAMQLDTYGTPVPSGYTVYLHMAQIKCATVMSDSCVQTYGAVGCYYTMFPRGTVPPAGFHPPSTTIPATPGGGDQPSSSRSRPRLLLPLLVGLLGGLLAAVLVGLGTLFVWRRHKCFRQHQVQKQQQEQQQQEQQQQEQQQQQLPLPTDPPPLSGGTKSSFSKDAPSPPLPSSSSSSGITTSASATTTTTTIGSRSNHGGGGVLLAKSAVRCWPNAPLLAHVDGQGRPQPPPPPPHSPVRHAAPTQPSPQLPAVVLAMAQEQRPKVDGTSYGSRSFLAPPAVITAAADPSSAFHGATATASPSGVAAAAPAAASSGSGDGAMVETTGTVALEISQAANVLTEGGWPEGLEPIREPEDPGAGREVQGRGARRAGELHGRWSQSSPADASHLHHEERQQQQQQQQQQQRYRGGNGGDSSSRGSCDKSCDALLSPQATPSSLSILPHPPHQHQHYQHLHHQRPWQQGQQQQQQQDHHQQYDLVRCLASELELNPVTSVTPLRAGVRLDDSRLGEQVQLLPVTLGKGSFGRVVEGEYGGVRVAVKLLNTGLLANVEMRAAAAAAAAAAGSPPPPVQVAAPLPVASTRNQGLDPAARGGGGDGTAASCTTDGVGGGCRNGGDDDCGGDSGGGAAGGEGGNGGGGGGARKAFRPACDGEGGGGGGGGAGCWSVGTQALEALAQEVEVLARCQHPNIVTLMAASLLPPRVCLVMELMDTSLDRLLHGVGSRNLSLGTVLHIGIQIARALSYLHPTILHRDLKPANVLISQPYSDKPVAKLADFGLSRLLQTVLVTRNPEVGTGPYIAPEVFDVTNTTVTDRADVYALGVVLWEMLTGRRPWPGQTTVQIAFAVAVNEERLPLNGLTEERCPPKLRALLQSCWDPDPARRPAAAEVVKALALVQEALTFGVRAL